MPRFLLGRISSPAVSGERLQMAGDGGCFRQAEAVGDLGPRRRNTVAPDMALDPVQNFLLAVRGASHGVVSLGAILLCVDGQVLCLPLPAHRL